MQYRKWEKGLLRADGKPGFDTPSGKFEIASTLLGEYGYEPCPPTPRPQESPFRDPISRGVSFGLPHSGAG